MKAFVESKVVAFDDIKITVCELSAEQLISIAGRDVTEGEILLLGSSLTAEEVKRLSSPAVRLIIDEFKALNKNIYQKSDMAEDGETKK